MLDMELPCAVGSQWPRGFWRDVASPSELWFSCRSGTCRLCGVPPWFGVSQQLRTVRGFERAEIPDNRDVAATSTANRGQYVRRGQRLEYFTIAYNSLEGAASIVAGLLAGSVSLVGFGLDSMIEVASGAALLWRLHHDMDISRREQAERTALRTVGACFVALALYIVYESSSTLIRHVLTGAKHRRHRDRERFGDCHAAAGASETASCSSDWQRSHARGFETGGFLCVPLRDSVGWPAC